MGAKPRGLGATAPGSPPTGRSGGRAGGRSTPAIGGDPGAQRTSDPRVREARRPAAKAPQPRPSGGRAQHGGLGPPGVNVPTHVPTRPQHPCARDGWLHGSSHGRLHRHALAEQAATQAIETTDCAHANYPPDFTTSPQIAPRADSREGPDRVRLDRCVRAQRRVDPADGAGCKDLGHLRSTAPFRLASFHLRAALVGQGVGTDAGRAALGRTCAAAAHRVPQPPRATNTLHDVHELLLQREVAARVPTDLPGLLIRRSLVRAQVGEPKNQRGYVHNVTPFLMSPQALHRYRVY
jgi:hypothetical protein